MELKHLEVNSLNKLNSVLKEVFGMDFDFAAGNAKLSKVKVVTETKDDACFEYQSPVFCGPG